MGRPSAGGGRSMGGGHSVGGGHSFSRSGGGHSVGGSGHSRPISSGSSSSPRPSSSGSYRPSSKPTHTSSPKPGYGSSHGPVYTGPIIMNTGGSHHGSQGSYNQGYGQSGTYHAPQNNSYGQSGSYQAPQGGQNYQNEERKKGSFSKVGAAIAIFFAFLLIFMLISMFSGGKSSGTSTIQREKLNTGAGFTTNCIEDELGWLDNESKTETKLQDFFEETGVQPYIYLKEYDPMLTDEADQEQWAIDYYDANFTREDVFLLIYYAAEDADNDYGYFAYADGKQVPTVMDSEAMEIFWNNLDAQWEDEDNSMDDVLVNTFNKTASTIMRVTTTSKDVMKSFFAMAAVALAGFFGIRAIRLRNQRKKEEAEEFQQILNTPVGDMFKDEADELTDLYAGPKEEQPGSGSGGMGGTAGGM